MHSLEMLQRMNSAKGSARIRRNAIILNTPGGHPKDAEKYGIAGTRTARRKGKILSVAELKRFLSNRCLTLSPTQ